MKIGFLLPAAAMSLIALMSAMAHGSHSHSDNQRPVAATNAAAIRNIELPPLPEGVAELKFSDFFRQPIGAHGAELTEAVRALDGRRVRILGYMVRQDRPVARQFLLTPFPVTLHEEEYGFAEDLPANTLHVLTAAGTPETVPFTPGLLLLTGKLSVGSREEADGRVSMLRLQLDAPAESRSDATLQSPVSSVRPEPKTK